MATQEEDVDWDMNVSAGDLIAAITPALLASSTFLKALAQSTVFVNALIASGAFVNAVQSISGQVVGQVVAQGLSR